MSDFIKTINMCLSMFTIFYIPCPTWDEKLRSSMLTVFPLVGVYLGIIFCILFHILVVFIDKINIYFIALILSLYPYISTGFIHLDGFMDVVDAISSCGNHTKMINILKDSHVGSFAVIKTIILFLASYISLLTILLKTCIYRLYDLNVVLTLIFITMVISRVLSSIALIKLNKLTVSEYSDEYQNDLDKIHISSAINNVDDNNTKNNAQNNYNTKLSMLTFIKYFFIKRKASFIPKVILILTLICSILINLFFAHSIATFIKNFFRIILQVIIIMSAHTISTYRCYKNFRGVNGDVSGYAICVSECISFIFISLI